MGSDTDIFGAVEAGGTKFVCAVADKTGQILARTVMPTTTPDDTFARVTHFFDQQQSANGLLTAIGVASFGPVSVNKSADNYGTILSTPKPGWEGVSYPHWLSRYGVPIMVETDVNGAALGESHAGAGQGCGTLAYVTVGTGIGVGIVRNGQPLRGEGHYEMGHIFPPHNARRDPYPGGCPFHGACLEGLASGPAITDRWGASLSDLSPDHPGFMLEADYLAYLAVTIILTHMPQRLIFGGGVMKTPGLIAAVRKATVRLLGGYVSAPPFSGDLADVIVPPALGDDAGITGALMMASMPLD